MVERRGDPWFEDGNLILLSRDSTYFRIHRGVLARQSEVFQSMLDFPQPSMVGTEMETMDGCQVVRMYDKGVELSLLLNAIYDGVTFHNREIEDFFVLASILRLSTKYYIMNLRRQAIGFLTKTWAYTLSGHDAMVEQALQTPASSNGTLELSYPYVHPLHVLSLARETNVPVVIPAALYFLSIYPFAELRACNHPKLLAESRIGLPRPEATMNTEDVGNYTTMYQHRIDLMLDFSRRFCGERRSSADCLRRKNVIINGVNLASSNANVSAENDPCSHSFAKLASRASRSWFARTGPLRWMVQTVQHIEGEGEKGPRSVCKKCRDSFRTDVEMHRRKIWEALPTVVGFRSWQELIEIDVSE